MLYFISSNGIENFARMTVNVFLNLAQSSEASEVLDVHKRDGESSGYVFVLE